jgi:hypothetical protein
MEKDHSEHTPEFGFIATPRPIFLIILDFLQKGFMKVVKTNFDSFKLITV